MNCNTPPLYRAGRTVSRVTLWATRIIDCAPTPPARNDVATRRRLENAGIGIAAFRCNSAATKRVQRLDRAMRLGARHH
jgi:hypothetical protein